MVEQMPKLFFKKRNFGANIYGVVATMLELLE